MEVSSSDFKSDKINQELEETKSSFDSAGEFLCLVSNS